MHNEWRALDQIERAQELEPHCSCGQPTTTVARPDGTWLECTSLHRPGQGWWQNLLNTMSGPHVRRQILDWVRVPA